MSDKEEDKNDKPFYYINYNGIDYKCYFLDSEDGIVALEENIDTLNEDLLYYEEIENYEQCIIIRDKIIKLKINNELK